MIPVMKQERPNTAKLYFCECGRRLVPGDDHGTERWAYCPRCGEHIEWDQVRPVVWEEKQCKVCGGWLVQKMSYGGFYASSDYIGEDICKTCWIEECLQTNCLACKRDNYPDCKWLDLKKYYQEKDM